MVILNKNNQKSKRKRGKKFIYNEKKEDKALPANKKNNPFEEFSKKNHMKIGNQVKLN